MFFYWKNRLLIVELEPGQLLDVRLLYYSCSQSAALGVAFGKPSIDDFRGKKERGRRFINLMD